MNDHDIPMSAPNLAPCSPGERRKALLHTAAFMLSNKPEMTAAPFTALVGDDMLSRVEVIAELTALSDAYGEEPAGTEAIVSGRLRAMEAILESLDTTPAMRNNRALEVLRGERLAEVEVGSILPSTFAPVAPDIDTQDLLTEALHAIQQLTLGQCRQSDIDPSLPQRMEFALRLK